MSQPETGAPDLTVLVPVYNEHGNLEPLAAEIAAALSGLAEFEIVFVDDGSDDGTGAELTRIAAANPHVRVLTHAERAGKSAALWTGGLHARGRWIQTLDGDRQDDPADVARLWRHLHESGAPDARLGLVAGARTRRTDSTAKRFGSRIANRVRRAMLADGTRDTGCGFKLIRAEALRAVPYFGGMHRFLPALVRRAGYDILEFPVTNRPRAAGTSKYGIWGRLGAGIVDLFGVFWLIRRGPFGRLKDGGE